MIYIDDSHWVKAGIEYCDGQAKLSVVVTNGYSDWSTQVWPSMGAKLKIHKILQGSSFVVEAAEIESDEFQFVRIAHLSAADSSSSDGGGGDADVEKKWKVGPFAASPIAQKGCKATFSEFTIGEKEKPTHSENL